MAGEIVSREASAARRRRRELRKREEQARRAADEVLRRRKHRSSSTLHQIVDGLAGRETGELARVVARVMRRRILTRDHAAFEALLRCLCRHRSPMLAEETLVKGVGRLAVYRRNWLRNPTDWRPRSYNACRQFSSLLRHLLARYDVPLFFDRAWLDASRNFETHRKWFIHIATGNNLRTAQGLPFPLTKAMAHHALRAPDDSEILHALRFGQVLALGGDRRLAAAVIGSRLGRAPHSDEAFWLGLIRLFATATMADPAEFGPVVDYLWAQKFQPEPARIVNGQVRPGEIPQPNLSLKGRTIESLVRQTRQWHRALARVRGGVLLEWPTSLPGPFERVEGADGNRQLWRLEELTSSRALIAEGRAMRHCVASYATSCAEGRCAIFSLTRDIGQGIERGLTIEVWLPRRQIVQARGRFNAPADALDQRIVKIWAQQVGLEIAKRGFVRWY
jgi:hypothetical protein